MGKSDIIRVILASDNNYFPYIYVAVKTLIKSNKGNEIDLYYIEDNVDKDNVEYLKELQNDSIKITVIPFRLPSPYDEVLPKYFGTTNTTYVKFWFSKMFPNFNKVLYLDPDVLVLDDLSELYSVCIDDYLIAGVIENLPEYHRYASHMDKESNYINGGMVLMNLKKWREENIDDKVMKRLLDNERILNFDQGILNEVCADKIYVLPPKFNALAELFEFKDANKIKARYNFVEYYTQKQVDEAIYKPVIVHFTQFLYGKPMNLTCEHPYASLFRWVMSLSPVKINYSQNELPNKIRVRRFVLRKFPFRVYDFFERLLDVRRRRKIL